jgi:hypothetical protein
MEVFSYAKCKEFLELADKTSAFPEGLLCTELFSVRQAVNIDTEKSF